MKKFIIFANLLLASYSNTMSLEFFESLEKIETTTNQDNLTQHAQFKDEKVSLSKFITNVPKSILNYPILFIATRSSAGEIFNNFLVCWDKFSSSIKDEQVLDWKNRYINAYFDIRKKTYNIVSYHKKTNIDNVGNVIEEIINLNYLNLLDLVAQHIENIRMNIKTSKEKISFDLYFSNDSIFLQSFRDKVEDALVNPLNIMELSSENNKKTEVLNSYFYIYTAMYKFYKEHPCHIFIFQKIQNILYKYLIYKDESFNVPNNIPEDRVSEYNASLKDLEKIRNYISNYISNYIYMCDRKELLKKLLTFSKE